MAGVWTDGEVFKLIYIYGRKRGSRSSSKGQSAKNMCMTSLELKCVRRDIIRRGSSVGVR